MFKLCVFFALVACSVAKPGFIGTPLVAAPAVPVAPVPVATSYANTYKVSVAAAPVVAHPAPLAYSAHPAPLAYAAHPVKLAYAAHPYAHAAPLAYVH